jgi:hypothetical protein
MAMERNSIGWTHPLVLAILGATVAAFGNMTVAFISGENQTRLEQRKLESALIVEAIKVGNPEKASRNLNFLIDAGIIENPGMKRNLSEYLRDSQTGNFPYIAPLTRERPPADLITDCKSVEERTIGGALDNRYSVIICERIKNCALRDWSVGGPGVCSASDIVAITALATASVDVSGG